MEKHIENHTVYVYNFLPMRDPVRSVFYYFCMFFAHWATMLIRVFTRRNFGIRYFDVGFAFRLTLILIAIPVLPQLIAYIIPYIYPIDVKVPDQVNDFAQSVGMSLPVDTTEQSAPAPESHPFLLWYVFVFFFAAFSFIRWREQRNQPSIFESPRHTRYKGDFQPWLQKIKIPKMKHSTRNLNCWIEPAVFFFPGLLLIFLGQYVGWLLVISAVIASGHENSAYALGRTAVLNTYDRLLHQQYVERVFNRLENAQEAQGKDGTEHYRTSAITEEDFRRALYAHAATSLPAFEVKSAH